MPQCTFFERVLRFPHILVHPLLRPNLLLYLSLVLRVLASEKVRLSQEVDPLAST